MKFRVTDWRYRNLRGIGVGELSINLGSPLNRWSLIQMPNGTGKTTTMKLIRAVLSGQKFTPGDVREFRADDEVADGGFELGLLINDKQYRLILTLDFNSGDFSYWTSRTKERGGGVDPGRALPVPLKHRLKPNFTRLFVFDGELAKEIRADDRAEADRAIKALYQLDDLDTLKHRVKEVVRERQYAAASLSHAKSQKGLTQTRNALAKAENVLAGLEKTLSNSKTKQSELEKEKNTVEAKISTYLAENGDLTAREKTIESEGATIRTDLQIAVSGAMNAFRSPVRLSTAIRTRLNELSMTLTDARLPKSVSSEFFSEVANREVCICGRPIGDEERAAIDKRKEDYLAKDQIAAISTMKKGLRNEGEPEISFQSACNALTTHVDARRVNAYEKEKLIEELANADNGEVAALARRLGEIETDLEHLRPKIEKLETRDIPVAKNKRDECDKKFNVASASYRLSRQCDVLVRQLSKIEKRALQVLRERIRNGTNERLASLVQMEKLQIARIDGALRLASDRVAERKGVSEGQSLSVAYAFLTSLLSEAPFQLPFIVDSPAVSLDLEVRREVGRIIPDLFDQMVMFVLTSEQAGFSESFYERTDTRFVSLSKGPGGEIRREYGLEAFKRLAEEAPAS